MRQLRLRDIGGIIVIDFIDMVLESNRDLVLRRLVECLGRDRTKHQVAEVTSLGLVQMTRKRIGQGLLEVVLHAVRALRRPWSHRARRSRSGSTPTRPTRATAAGIGRPGDPPGRSAAPVALGGKQTGRTPPPPKFDDQGHIEHDDHQHDEHGEHPHDELADVHGAQPSERQTSEPGYEHATSDPHPELDAHEDQEPEHEASGPEAHEEHPDSEPGDEHEVSEPEARDEHPDVRAP